MNCASTARCFCFNWATRSRAWKPIIAKVNIQSFHMLQLGHALSRVETTEPPEGQPSARKASIGPRALARGNKERLKLLEHRASCFNWATRSRAWKPIYVHSCYSSVVMLQLGHALS